MSRKLVWRFRKRSEVDPIKVLPCGCQAKKFAEMYVYDGTIIKHCAEHMPDYVDLLAEQDTKSEKAEEDSE